MQIKTIIALIFFTALAGCSRIQHPGASAPAVATTIKVMSYNIHHGNPPSAPGVINLDTIAVIIKNQNPDLVALQEVDVRTRRSGATLDEAAYLAEKAGMTAYFAKAMDYDGGAYGVAVLSKYPIKERQTIALPIVAGSGAELRAVARIVVQLTNGEELVFASTHLDFKKNSPTRLLQVREINRVFQSEKRPVILAGDFNDTPQSETLQLLHQQFGNSCTDCPFTIPEVNPNRTIDFILFSPKSSWQVTGHRVLNESFASDHLPIVATLQKK